MRPGVDLHFQIAQVACRLCEDRGRVDGFGLEDWLTAEERVRGSSEYGGREFQTLAARPAALWVGEKNLNGAATVLWSLEVPVNPG